MPGTELEGQLTLFSLLEEPKKETTDARIWCQHCRSNWGPGLKAEALDRLREEHREESAGRCSHMVQHGVTEPYYAPGETPWLSGWSVPRPRPAGYRGLDQLATA